MRASTEPYARLLAQTARQRFSASWALAESGATGPTGNRYGDAAGHSCIAVSGASERAITLETGSSRPRRQHACVQRGGARPVGGGAGKGTGAYPLAGNVTVKQLPRSAS